MGSAPGLNAAVIIAEAPGLGGVCGMAPGVRLGAGRFVPCRAARSFSYGMISNMIILKASAPLTIKY